MAPLTEVLHELDVEGSCQASAHPDSKPAMMRGGPAFRIRTTTLLCREEYVAMGLFHVAKALSFLNNDCKLVCPLKVQCPIISVPECEKIVPDIDQADIIFPSR